MTENDLSKIVVDISVKIHKRFGPGLFESVYEELLCYELEKHGLAVKRQCLIPLEYDDFIIHAAFRADVIVENQLLLELKSVEQLPAVYYKQVITYLRLTNLRLGLLLNFNVVLMKDGIYRIANNL